MRTKLSILVMVLLACVMSFTACDVNGKLKAAKLKEEEQQRLEEEKKLEEQKLIDITYVFGDKPASEGLKNVSFKTGVNTDISFRETNVAQFVVNGILSNSFYGIYTLKDNELTFDLSRSIHKDVTAEQFLKAERLFWEYQLKTAEELLKKEGITESERKKAETDIKMIKRGLEELKTYTPNDAWVLENVKRIQQLSKDIEPINPITATISADKKTLTLKKMLVKQNADGTAEYAENVVFTRR